MTRRVVADNLAVSPAASQCGIQRWARVKPQASIVVGRSACGRLALFAALGLAATSWLTLPSSRLGFVGQPWKRLPACGHESFGHGPLDRTAAAVSPRFFFKQKVQADSESEASKTLSTKMEADFSLKKVPEEKTSQAAERPVSPRKTLSTEIEADFSLKKVPEEKTSQAAEAPSDMEEKSSSEDSPLMEEVGAFERVDDWRGDEFAAPALPDSAEERALALVDFFLGKQQLSGDTLDALRALEPATALEAIRAYTDDKIGSSGTKDAWASGIAWGMRYALAVSAVPSSEALLVGQKIHVKSGSSGKGKGKGGRT